MIWDSKDWKAVNATQSNGRENFIQKDERKFPEIDLVIIDIKQSL